MGKITKLSIANKSAAMTHNTKPPRLLTSVNIHTKPLIRKKEQSRKADMATPM